jgi:hypothetical protein
MWVSAAILHRSDAGEATAAIADLLRTAATAPTMVVDGRAYDVRGGATGTYRLMKDLGLARACPVACWCGSADAAWDHLALIVGALAPGEAALLVATDSGSPQSWGAALVSAGKIPATPRRLSKPSLADPHGNGFLQLITHAAHDTSSLI